jgi:hypothetical protein
MRGRLTIALVVTVVAAGCGGGGGGPRTVAGTASTAPRAPAALGLTRRLPAAYRAICREQAAYAPPGARTCPPLIPAGRVRVLAATPFSKAPHYRGGYLADLGSRSISTLRGAHVETNGGHWHFDVSWTPAVRQLLVRRGVERPANAARPSSCRHTRVDAEAVEACDVVPHEQGGGLNGGHVAYVWTRGAITYVISLHGYANEPRARAMMLALIDAVLHR